MDRQPTEFYTSSQTDEISHSLQNLNLFIHTKEKSQGPLRNIQLSSSVQQRISNANIFRQPSAFTSVLSDFLILPVSKEPA